MARKRQTTKGVIAGSIKKSKLQTTDSILQTKKDVSSTEEFYELEPVEILDVHLDDSKPSFPKTADDKPDYSFIGGILGRFVYSEQGKNIDKCTNFKSINIEDLFM